ncbi:MAG: serine hydrolase [Pseudomonadota bacterium]
MKKTIFVASAALTLAVFAGVLNRSTLLELLTLYEYSQLFAENAIEENFRTMHLTNSSVHISRQGPVFELEESRLETVSGLTYSVDSETRHLEDLLAETNTTGFAIFHDDELVHEAYYRGNTRETLAIQMSVSKSFASFLVGVAIDEGNIGSVDDFVTAYVPALSGSAFEGVTIEQVLDMSTGIRWDEDYGKLDSEVVRSIIATRLGSLDTFVTTIERDGSPGDLHHYASINTHVLGMVVRGATGMEYADYFEQKLWSRLGPEADAFFITDTENQPLVLGGLVIRLRDMIRFGVLYLENGRNHLGEQLVSPGWVASSTTPDAPRLMPGKNNPKSKSWFGYKHQWWIPLKPDHGDYAAIGIYGQFIYVNPARRVVIAKTSAYSDYLEDGGWKDVETLQAFQSVARVLAPLPEERAHPRGAAAGQ